MTRKYAFKYLCSVVMVQLLKRTHLQTAAFMVHSWYSFWKEQICRLQKSWRFHGTASEKYTSADCRSWYSFWKEHICRLQTSWHIHGTAFEKNTYLQSADVFFSEAVPWLFYFDFMPWLPTSVAQLDAHLTGDQEVAGSTSARPAGSLTFFRWDWSWNTLLGHSLPSADSRRAVITFWQKNAHITG